MPSHYLFFLTRYNRYMVPLSTQPLPQIQPSQPQPPPPAKLVQSSEFKMFSQSRMAYSTSKWAHVIPCTCSHPVSHYTHLFFSTHTHAHEHSNTHTCMHVHIRTCTAHMYSWSSTYDDNKQQQYHFSLASVVQHQLQQAPSTICCPPSTATISGKKHELWKKVRILNNTHTHTSICLLSSLLLSILFSLPSTLCLIYKHYQIRCWRCCLSWWSSH